MGFLDVLGFGIPGAIGGAIQSGLNYKMMKDQQKFQREMRETAYQTAARDLEKAGLNRILALGSPAAQPSTGMAAMPNIMEGMSSNAIQANTMPEVKSKMQQEVKNLLKEANLIDARGNLTKAQYKMVVAQTSEAEFRANLYRLGDKYFDKYGEPLIDRLMDYLESGKFDKDIEEVGDTIINVVTPQNPMDWRPKNPLFSPIWPNLMTHDRE